jgi:hypothetical protein
LLFKYSRVCKDGVLKLKYPSFAVLFHSWDGAPSDGQENERKMSKRGTKLLYRKATNAAGRAGKFRPPVPVPGGD